MFRLLSLVIVLCFTSLTQGAQPTFTVENKCQCNIAKAQRFTVTNRCGSEVPRSHRPFARGTIGQATIAPTVTTRELRPASFGASVPEGTIITAPLMGPAGGIWMQGGNCASGNCSSGTPGGFFSRRGR